MSTYVLYNSLSGNGTGKTKAEEIKPFLSGKELVFEDVTKITDANAFFAGLNPDDELYLCGGDGTLNRFINNTDGIDIVQPLYFFPTGTGNDFWNDLGKKVGDAPVQINEYIKDLPFVEVNGMKKRFINGIGYGIDGYCCEVGDKQRAKDNGKQINYTSIAIKGLLFHYKPTKASVTVDGKLYAFDKTWLAPTMNGRCYGGGMYAAPDQDRLNPERTVTVMVMHSRGKIGTLAAFPSIFTGDHVKKKDIVTTIVGKSVRVEFDRPVALQIDGETVLNVREYEVETAEA